MTAFILLMSLHIWAEFDMISSYLPHDIIGSDSKTEGWNHLKTHFLLTHMSDGWHCLLIGFLLGLWSEHLYVTFQCGCLDSSQHGLWVPSVSVPKGTTGQKFIPFYDLTLAVTQHTSATWNSLRQSPKPPQFQGKRRETILLEWVIPRFWQRVWSPKYCCCNF